MSLAGSGDGPFFFLSYRRAEYAPSDGSHPDRWVKKLYDDLCQDVYQLTYKTPPGYMDVQTPLGQDWQDAMVRALSSCKVFVPLLHPGYFNSEWCGKEWDAFTRRLQEQSFGGDVPPAILPAIWRPFTMAAAPAMVKDIQLIPDGFPAAYAKDGFYGLIKTKRSSADYRKSVLRMAQLIQEAGENLNLAPSSAMTVESLQNAFAEYQAGNATHQIRLTVAAYPAGSAADDERGSPVRARSNYYYGHTMREWMPYRNPRDTTLIAQCAERVISRLGHRAVLDPLDDRAAAPQPSPAVMLVDPWAPGVPGIAAELRAIDEGPVHVVVPWNHDDDETTREETRLQANLDGAVPRSLGLFGSAQHVPTLEAFHSALPKAVNAAIAKHFKTAPAYPPRPSGQNDRPTLGGLGT